MERGVLEIHGKLIWTRSFFLPMGCLLCLLGFSLGMSSQLPPTVEVLEGLEGLRLPQRRRSVVRSQSPLPR
jgi:hypothetical protein